MSNFDQCWRRCLDEIDEKGLRRRLRDADRLANGMVDLGKGPLLDFASNDSLGLSRHPDLIANAQAFLERWGTGAGASRLVNGNLPPTSAIEAKMAAAKGAEAALLLASGFQANATLLPALLDRRVLGAEPLVFADRLIHASLIQGGLAAGVRLIRFRHNDLGHLAELLAKHESEDRTKFIVTETVFSMDGDRADFGALVDLARQHAAFLYLDEAHATGTQGENGFGLAHGVAGSDCLVMGTFSKAMGSFGAYAACSAALKELLLHRCSGLVFATALPPAVLGAIDAAIDLVPDLGAERSVLARHGATFRAAMKELGLDTGSSSTHIVPVILGSASRAMAVAAKLEAAGFLAIAIRPPTVPQGTSRLRISFSARHSDGEIQRLIEAIRQIVAGTP